MDATSEVAERYLEGDRDLARRGGDVRRDAGQGRAPGRNRTGPGFGGSPGLFRGVLGYRGARQRTYETLVPQAFPACAGVNRSPRFDSRGDNFRHGSLLALANISWQVLAPSRRLTRLTANPGAKTWAPGQGA